MGVEVVAGTIQDQSADAFVIRINDGSVQSGQTLLLSKAAGNLGGKIGVADLNTDGTCSAARIEESIRSIIAVVERESFWSVAMPVIGTGPSGILEVHALAIMMLTLHEMQFMGGVTIVRG